MHGGTQRQEKPFSAFMGCDVAHAAEKNPPDGGVERVLLGLDAVWRLTRRAARHWMRSAGAGTQTSPDRNNVPSRPAQRRGRIFLESPLFIDSPALGRLPVCGPSV